MTVQNNEPNPTRELAYLVAWVGLAGRSLDLASLQAALAESQAAGSQWSLTPETLAEMLAPPRPGGGGGGGGPRPDRAAFLERQAGKKRDRPGANGAAAAPPPDPPQPLPKKRSKKKEGVSLNGYEQLPGKRRFVMPPGCYAVYLVRLPRIDESEFGLLRTPDGAYVAKTRPDLRPGEINLVLR